MRSGFHVTPLRHRNTTVSFDHVSDNNAKDYTYVAGATFDMAEGKTPAHPAPPRAPYVTLAEAQAAVITDLEADAFRTYDVK